MYLRVFFPSGRYYASLSHNPSVPEWPPHPSRLFSALVAAAYTGSGGMTDGKRSALEWLEEQPSPSIAAPPSDCTEAPVSYVPPADSVGRKGKKGEERYEHGIHRWRQPRYFPNAIMLGEPLVYFQWDKDPDTKTLNALDDIASELTHVGTSHSMAVSTVHQGEMRVPATHLPHLEGSHFLRNPAPGRLKELDALYEGTAGLRRPLPTCEVTVPYELEGSASSEVMSSPFELLPLKISGTMHGADTAAYLGKSLRRAVMSVLGDKAPPSTHGHDQGTHIAWIPLPDVGHGYATGRVVGVGILFPRSIPDLDKNEVLLALRRLQQLYLPDGRKLQIDTLMPGEPSPKALWPRTWTGPSKTWATVTPVILDRPPKKLQGESLRMAISQSLVFAGYPEPEEIEVSSFSTFEGAPPAFQVPAKKPRYHAVVRFGKAIEGPIVAGRLRYFGIGLFRPFLDGKRE